MNEKIKQGDIVRFTLENIKVLRRLGFDSNVLRSFRSPLVVLNVQKYINPLMSEPNTSVMAHVRLVTHRGKDIYECNAEQLEYFPFPIKVLRK